MKPGTSTRNTSGMPKASHRFTNRAALSAESLSRMPPRWRRLRGDDPHRSSADPRQAGDDRARPLRLEVQPGAVVDDQLDHVVHVVRLAVGLRQHVEQRVLARSTGSVTSSRGGACSQCDGEERQILADARDALRVVGDLEVAHAGLAAVHAGTAELLWRDLLADRGAHEVRAGQRHRALPGHHRHEVRQAGDVRRARRARTHQRGHLRDDAAHHHLLAEQRPVPREQRADRLLDRARRR